MVRITIYLADDVEAQARKAARAKGASAGRWIAELVAEKVRNSWPPEVLAAVGSFPDFPEQAELRSGYGADAARAPLN
jgi:hypothetical protein